jgi:hypothetical protein
VAKLADAHALGACSFGIVGSSPTRGTGRHAIMCRICEIFFMSDKETAILPFEKYGAIPELDLHGFYPDQAENKVDVFLYERYKKGEDSIRIIYGLGKGVMEETVLAYLENHPLVAEIKKDVGSCIVVFER